MKLPKGFWFWEILPLWFCFGIVLLVAGCNPEYFRILFRPSFTAEIQPSTILEMIASGFATLLLAAMILSNTRSLWSNANEDGSKSPLLTHLVCPILTLSALIVTTVGTLAILMIPAAFVMVDQMHR